MPILLFKDYGADYWVASKIVDCGSKDNNQKLNTNLELPDDDINYENNLLLLEEESINNNKKLNIKYKQYQPKNINEPKYEQIYIRRNSKTVNRNSRTPDSRNKFSGPINKYKDSDFRINNTPDSRNKFSGPINKYKDSDFRPQTPKHISLYKYASTNNHKREVY